MTNYSHEPTGASTTPTEDLKHAARHEYDDARHRIADQAERLKRDGGATIRTVVTDELDRRKSGVGAEIRTLAETLRHAATEQSRNAESGVGAAPSSLLGQGADVLESLSSGLESHSVSDLTRSVSDYARANPAIFIGGCILAGLAVGRLLTASEHKSGGVQQTPYRPAAQPPAYRAQEQPSYAAAQAREPGTEPPIFGTPGTTMRDADGSSIADTSPSSLRREDNNGL